jgi:adenosylcobinamide kinase/adenosylcobinamide-phosphate guanylyltransferase
VYVATGGTREGDAEWSGRVSAHRARRPAAWRTRETTGVADLLRGEPAPLLVDCLGLWLTARLDDAGAWNEDADGRAAAVAKVDADCADLVDALRWRRGAPVVLVSNEVGMGVVPATPAGRLYRDLLGRLNAAVSAACDETVLMVAGRAVGLDPAPEGPR